MTQDRWRLRWERIEYTMVCPVCSCRIAIYDYLDIVMATIPLQATEIFELIFGIWSSLSALTFRVTFAKLRQPSFTIYTWKTVTSKKLSPLWHLIAYVIPLDHAPYFLERLRFDSKSGLTHLALTTSHHIPMQAVVHTLLNIMPIDWKRTWDHGLQITGWSLHRDLQAQPCFGRFTLIG